MSKFSVNPFGQHCEVLIGNRETIKIKKPISINDLLAMLAEAVKSGLYSSFSYIGRTTPNFNVGDGPCYMNVNDHVYTVAEGQNEVNFNMAEPVDWNWDNTMDTEMPVTVRRITIPITPETTAASPADAPRMRAEDF